MPRQHEQTAEKTFGLLFIVLACLQKMAGVSTANRIPPIVEWSSARIEAVCGDTGEFAGTGSRNTSVRRRSPSISDAVRCQALNMLTARTQKRLLQQRLEQCYPGVLYA